MSKKAAVIMGSDSDLPVMQEAIDKLKHFGIPVEVRIISAHRTPAAAEQFATHAAENGFGVIIAGAGKAAHLGGVLAAYTTLPVIGVPINVGVNGAANAGILAAQMLAIGDAELKAKLADFKEDMAKAVAAKDEKVRAQFEQ